MDEQQPTEPASYGRFERRAGPTLRDRAVDRGLNLFLVLLLVAFLGVLGFGAWWWLFGGGEEPEGSYVGAEDALVGDCAPSLAEGTVYVVDVVPCTEPHYAEAYATFDLPAGLYPGDEAAAQAAERGCIGRFAGFVGRPFRQSELGFSFLYPSGESWESSRGVSCWVILPGEQLATGTLRGADR